MAQHTIITDRWLKKILKSYHKELYINISYRGEKRLIIQRSESGNGINNSQTNTKETKYVKKVLIFTNKSKLQVHRDTTFTSKTGQDVSLDAYAGRAGGDTAGEGQDSPVPLLPPRPLWEP